MDNRLEGLIVRKIDWTLEPFSNVHENLILEHFLSKEDVEVLKLGFKPFNMDDRWFTYYEGGRLYCYRSWSGLCMFVVTLNSDSNEQYVTAYSYVENRTEDLKSFATRTLKKLLPYLVELGTPKMEYYRKIQASLSNSNVD